MMMVIDFSNLRKFLQDLEPHLISFIPARSHTFPLHASLPIPRSLSHFPIIPFLYPLIHICSCYTAPFTPSFHRNVNTKLIQFNSIQISLRGALA